MIIRLDLESEVPIYLQLRNQIVIGIGRGEFEVGESLPTVRQLAEEIGINAMTVNKAYGVLKREGYISVNRRHGAKINPIVKEATFEEKLKEDLELVIAEAGMKGVGKEDFFRVCEKVYKEMRAFQRSIVIE